MTARPVSTTPSQAELYAFKLLISYGIYSHAIDTDNKQHQYREQFYRCKQKLGLNKCNVHEALAWTLLNHPDWIIEESPIGKALSGLLKLASLGKNVQEYMSANSR